MAVRPAQPFFLSGEAGRLYALYFPPASRAAPLGVVLVPPFAEEMNRSRRMLALQARALADRGIAALIFDLYGTGDSAGDFGEATLPIWRADLDAAIDSLRARDAERIALLGMRFGALLAAERARRSGDIAALALWQPVLNGEAMLTQFLRLRVAATMAASEEARESTQRLRGMLRDGQPVEVAGYELSPELARAIDALRLVPPPSHGAAVHWFELAAAPGSSLAPASARMVENWADQGVRVSARVVSGEPFWSLPEVTVVPELIRATAGAFTGPDAA